MLASTVSKEGKHLYVVVMLYLYHNMNLEVHMRFNEPQFEEPDWSTHSAIV